MVAHPDCAGLEASILVGGVALEEFDGQHKVKRSSVERFVQASSEENFEIRFKFRPPFSEYRAVSVIITVDDRDVDTAIIPPEDLFDEEGHVIEGPVSNLGSTFTVQKFRFSALKVGKCF
jgi:hypothetical protein